MSISDAMDNCSRIRKNVTENREQTEREQKAEKPFTESPLITNGAGQYLRLMNDLS